MLQYIAIQLRGRAAQERGASAVEYGLLVALIAAIIVVGVTVLGTTLLDIFNSTEDKIDGVPAAP